MGEQLSDSVALVVGGTAGIGRSIAERFAEEGAAVAVASRNDEPRDGEVPTHERIREAGGEAVFVRCDLRDRDSVDGTVKTVLDEYGGLDAVLNSAGTIYRGPITETPEEEMRRVVDVNLLGPMRLARAALPALVESEGTLINVTSEAGQRGIANLPAYCASKGGLDTLTRALAVEWGPEKVTVNAIAPGTTKTAMNKQVREEDPSWIEERRAAIPLGELNEPTDVADLAVFLASDGADKITGAVVPVDGGATSK